MKTIDKTGIRYGRLTVVSPAHKSGYKRYWLCRCDCGAEKTVQGENLTNGHVQSCGCMLTERMLQQNRTHGRSRGDITYRSWASMKQRCLNPNHDNWEDYGGRGIKVCDRWRHSFENFIVDLGERPSPNHTLERIKNSVGYEPNNVRWATAHEQTRNTRYNRIVTFNGVTTNVTDAALSAGLPRNAVFKRLESGWTIERALTAPLRRTAPRRVR